MKKITILIVICLIYLTTDTSGASIHQNFRSWLKGFINRSIRERLIYATKCIDGLECYYTGPPWHSLGRPLSLTPSDREDINTQFLLVTRRNPTDFQTLRAKDEATFTASKFDKTKPVKFLIHGWLEKGTADFVKDWARELLLDGDYNVISVDWSGGAYTLYSQSVANIRVVGTEVALMIQYMEKKFDVLTKDIHIIGHSLGAHIAGLAGERTNKLGRITALDAAQPYFQNQDISVRLDPTDAGFVDVVHTDANDIGIETIIGKGGLGIWQPVGHLDFYPNGGKYQPNCSNNVIINVGDHGVGDGFKQTFGCSHMRARDYFTHSINAKCKFNAFECADWDTYKSGRCFGACNPNASHTCGYMGYHADKLPRDKTRTEVKLFLATSGRAPYCGQQFSMKIEVAQTSDFNNERGNIEVDVVDSDTQSTGTIQIFDDTTTLYGGKSYYKIFVPDTPLRQHHTVMLRWKYSWKWIWEAWRKPSLPITRIVLEGSDGDTVVFCSRDKSAPHDQWIQFQPPKWGEPGC